MLEIRTLGGLSTYWHGERLHLGTRKGLALLTYLALHFGRSFARPELASLLWHGVPSTRARHSLSQTIYSIKKVVPVQLINSTRHNISIIDKQVRVDALDFEDYLNEGQVDKAVDLYRGDFLDGFWLEDVHAFCRWQELKRSEFRQAMNVALYELLQRAERGGNWVATERIAQRILKLNPYDERVHRIRLLAIAATGDRKRLDREYRSLVKTFQKELGRQPSEAIRGVAERMDTEHDQVVSVVTEPDTDAQIPFTGRDGEFSTFRSEWFRVKDGTGVSVLVTGEAGIGKTRFCRHFLRWAVLQNARVFAGRCYPSEACLPYSGAVDALLDGLQPDDLHAIPQAWSAVVSELLPEMRRDDTPSSLPLPTGEGARRRLFEGIARLLIALSEELPVVLFIDDFHWADDSTSALVQYLGRRLKRCRVLIIVALRPEDVPDNSTVELFLAAIGESNHLQEIRLDELDKVGVDNLITSYADRTNLNISNALRRILHQQAGGRPFLLLEVLRSLQRGEPGIHAETLTAEASSVPVLLPESVEDFLVSRLTELDSAATLVISSLAVIGRESPTTVIRDMTELPVEAFVESTELLVHKRLLQERNSAITFTHDLVREATYRSLSAVRRTTLHEKAAMALQKRQDVAAGTLAVHFDLAGNSTSAHKYAIEAATAAEKVHAHHELTFFLRMALANAPTVEQRYAVQHRLAKVLYEIRRYSEADTLYQGLEQHYGTHDHLQLLSVEVDRLLIASKQDGMPPEDLVSRLQSCAELAQKNQHYDQLSRILFKLVEIAVDLGRLDLLNRIKPRLLALSDDARNTFPGIEALREAAVLVGLSESVPAGLQHSEEAVRQARASDNAVALISALSGRAINRLQAGLLSQAEEDFSRSFKVSNKAAILRYKNSLFNNYGVLLLEQGKYDEAAVAFDKGIRLAQEASAYDEFLIVYENQSALHYEIGDFDKARSVAQKIISNPRRESRWWSTIIAWSILGLCALRRSNFSEANRYRREILLRWEDRNFWIGDCSYPETFLARLAASEGREAQALERLERAIAAYEHRDVLCRSRLELERARLLIEEEPLEARRAAGSVRERAAEMGARPLVEKAERIMTRADMRM